MHFVVVGSLFVSSISALSRAKEIIKKEVVKKRGRNTAEKGLNDIISKNPWSRST